LFVVLLVIVSMLNAAAIVVFVNKAQPLQPQLDALGQQLASARNEAAANLAAKEKAEGQYNTEAQLHLNDNSNNQAAIAKVQEKINSDQVAIARLTADNTGLQTALNTANSNVQLSTATASKSQDQVTDLRKTNDGLAKSNEEFGRRNAELTSTLESQTARMEEAQEQLSQTKEDKQKLASALKQRGYDADAILSAPTEALAAPAIEGVVRDKSVINGNTFVTISVGSQDGVAKGMKFNVLDGPDFLGIVTIDTVDTDNAIGRLQPVPGKEDRVQKGNEVKTQIRGS
jgi:myosin heavy subunit